MSQKPNSDEVLQEAVDAHAANGYNVTRAANDLNISRTTLQSRLTEAKRRGFKPAHESAEVILKQEREARKEKAEENELRVLFKESERQNELLQKKLDVVMDLQDGYGQRTVIPPNMDTDGNGIFCGVLSDLHLEEDVSPESIPGYQNRFNPAIARQRMTKLFQSYVFMLDAWRHVGACDTAILAVLGDVITGYIHDELMESNHMSPAKAILFAQELLGSGIEYILKHGRLKRLRIPWSYGNHGRTTVKSRIQTGADNSYEYLLGRTMAREWAREKRIEWQIADGYHNNVDVFGNYRIRFHHGDSVSYGGGVGGLTIPLLKKIAGWNSGSPRPANLDVLGHFHRVMDGGNFIVNGSLIGFNAYALSIGAAYEPPQQVCFWIDSKRGKTMTGRLYVE